MPTAAMTRSALCAAATASGEGASFTADQMSFAVGLRSSGLRYWTSRAAFSPFTRCTLFQGDLDALRSILQWDHFAVDRHARKTIRLHANEVVASGGRSERSRPLHADGFLTGDLGGRLLLAEIDVRLNARGDGLRLHAGTKIDAAPVGVLG